MIESDRAGATADRRTDPKALLDVYRVMLTIRRTEEELARAHQRGRVHGACHTYVGQEAIAAGVCAHLRADDVVFSTHRGHGHALAKGVPPREIMAELFGRSTGCSGGRGGSMHLFSPERGLMGTSGIVGPSILQAAGGGYSFQLLGSDRVAVAFFGDGAVQNGAFHEGLNLAGIWKLPVLFVCEQNSFATEIPFEYAAARPDVACRGAIYGLPSVSLDGNDVEAVLAAAGEAVQRARIGGGATLLECVTYRTRAHAEGMPDYTYRERAEVERWKARCPIARLRGRLLDRDGISADDFAAIDAQVEGLVHEARDFAESSPWPDPATAAEHVLAENEHIVASPRSRGQESDPEPRAPAQPREGAADPMDSARAPELREISFSEAVLEALAEEMAVNPKIFVLGEGIGQRGGNFRTTAGLYELYGPQRLRDTPICERGFVGLACGAAMTGTRPVVDFMFADFVLDALGEVIHQISKMRYMSSGRLSLPILLRGCVGVGHSAGTHHSGSYYSLFGQIPGLHVVVPSCPRDAKGLLKRALRCPDPVIFLEPRELLTGKGPVPRGDYEVELGQARVARAGRDATVVAIARMVPESLQAAEALAAEGASVEVIDLRSVAPLDIETILESVRKTGRLLIADEAPAPFGVGAEVAARIADVGFDELDAPIRRWNGAHVPTPYSPTLEAAVVPSHEQIAAALRRLLEE